MFFSLCRASRWARRGLALALATSLAAYTAAITPDRKAALDHISAQSLQGHVSFLASDLLEGRDTPSRGLDIAAEYIASQFRRAGLKPAGDDGYFQTAHYVTTGQALDGVELTVRAANSSLQIPKSEMRILAAGKAEFSDVTPLKISLDDVKPDSVAGRVLVVATKRRDAMAVLRKLKPSAVLLAYSSAGRAPEVTERLEDVEQRSVFPVIRIHNHDFFKLAEAAKPGAMEVKLSLRLPPPVERPVNLRNVVGLLPGSDPTLGGTYVLISAHYDHLGMKPSGEGDLIFNGANDDASGVASMIEMASALSASTPAPRRSILFIAYFGEEKGLLGSRYYGRHPLFPLKKTVADLNLEHLGRTDGPNGSLAGTATMTGYGYSDITTAFEMAGAATGLKIYAPERNGDDYFARSDNQSLADQGVPAHTFLTAFEFPDYHKVGDEWNKIDYANLAKVNRAIALTVMMIADDPLPPHWNESSVKTEKYVKAWRELK
jgi:hypothetical protein